MITLLFPSIYIIFISIIKNENMWLTLYSFVNIFIVNPRGTPTDNTTDKIKISSASNIIK